VPKYQLVKALLKFALISETPGLSWEPVILLAIGIGYQVPATGAFVKFRTMVVYPAEPSTPEPRFVKFAETVTATGDVS
jgi:hypothetical protein